MQLIRTSLGRIVASVVLALGAMACAPSDPSLPAAERIEPVVPAALIAQANHGRDIFDDHGYFRFPASVRRVWIDVGAHHLETTKAELRYDDVAVVAIEPLSEAWETWPDSDRVIGVPVAIYLERGNMDFHVNALDDTSSLLESTDSPSRGSVTRTVEVRSVSVLTLEDVLRAVPSRYSVAYVKTDVQGVDLQVIQSARDSLKRVERVRTEIINSADYKKLNGQGMSSESEMVTYLQSKGFRDAQESGVQLDRAWLDQNFVNGARSWIDRNWHDFKFGVPNS